jgi:hypothetical protein
MTFEDIVQEISKFSLRERKTLISLLVESLAPAEMDEKSHDILAFEGVGARLRDEDAQAYVNRLRAEWDDRLSPFNRRNQGC